jgi:hypothetical protein
VADTPQAAQTDQAAASETGRREMTLRIDESDMDTAYTNTIRSSSTIDEVILDFGMNLPVAGKQDELVFKVRQQSVMNWRCAKRLALTLSNMVRQHEDRFGEIELNPMARKTEEK